MLAVLFLAAGALVTSAVTPASGAAATFTTITTPSHNLIYRLDEQLTQAQNTFTVKGKASLDVDMVDIVCIVNFDNARQVETLASDVDVSGSGTFTAVASFDDVPMGLTLNCRLRAVPVGYDVDEGYLAPFAGPLLYVNGVSLLQDGPGPVYGMFGVGEQGDGVAAITSAGECGAALIATVETPSMTARGFDTLSCAFGLPATNATAGGIPTGSTIQVDGNNAYLPGAVHQLNDTADWSLPQSRLTVSVSRPNSKGDVAITETAPLMRCVPENTFPPTDTSCTGLSATGVTFKRVSLIFRGAHQIRIRDTFIGNGQAHTVRLQYEAGAGSQLEAGAPGYLFPGRSSFVLADPGQSVTKLGGKAATMFVRTDKFATADDPSVATFGLSWSKAPQQVLFAGGSAAGLYGMRYSVHVPVHGRAYLGFAYSQNLLTAKVKPLAALGVADMMSTPTIGSPRNGAHIAGHSVTVKGSVAIGANGLPTSVKVNGHVAQLTVNRAKTAVSYRATFSEPFGKHKVTVRATDSAGNARTRSITVTNVRVR
jgi:hypothetical protein